MEEIEIILGMGTAVALATAPRIRWRVVAVRGGNIIRSIAVVRPIETKPLRTGSGGLHGEMPCPIAKGTAGNKSATAPREVELAVEQMNRDSPIGLVEVGPTGSVTATYPEAVAAIAMLSVVVPGGTMDRERALIVIGVRQALGHEVAVSAQVEALEVVEVSEVADGAGKC